MWPLLIFILFLLICKEAIQKPESYPPGPPLMPIIGNLFSLWLSLKKLKYHHSVWQEWSKKYGNILGLRLGYTNVVVVSGRDLIKEVSSKDVFDGRPNGFFYLLRSFNKKLGLVFSDGATWHKTRRMVLKCLKNFGYGSRSMESNISEECKALIDLRMADAGMPVVVNHMFDVCIVNILWKLVAGRRYDLTNEQLTILCDLITRSFKVVDMSGGILNFMPFLRHVFPNLIGYNELIAIHDSLYDFLRTTIQEHQNTIDIKKPRDVIDMFLIEMNSQKNESFSTEELLVICLDLLEAGVETVSNTTVFMLLHIVRNQEVQRKLQYEIDTQVGSSRRPTLSDRSKMVYTEAVLLETLRISSVAAVGIPHMALEDARLGNYTIPKGTFVLLAIHDLHNGEHWKDSLSFRPERFLTREGNLIQDDWLMPFGSGKRRCIGEGLARSELFMFLTHLLQRFNLTVPEGDSLPSADPIDGVTLSAKEFKIVFEPRNNSFM
ncbi:farnesoate epoxidase-like [Pararge aegeria]|uniref:Jg25316 protein n=1 Tax=Pararge aegeria aegeria TaxID=348720 RepID=A0A8S4S1I9_9NEOP|nr:farnesoate epoxidase-like [Pararge aegeria]CAH2244365.1 jg25316 [Pararge aegeria aegeria]